MTPSERIKNYRLMNNITQKRLASKMGITPVYLQKLESGDRNISMPMAHKLHAVSKKDFPLAVMLGIE